MLKLNKEEVHFLVTAEMKKEVADFLEAVDAKIAPVLEYIKENQVERVYWMGKFQCCRKHSKISGG